MALPYFQMSCNNSESSEDTTCLFFTGGTATQESMFSTVHHDLSVVWLHGSVQIRSILSEALLVSRSRGSGGFEPHSQTFHWSKGKFGHSRAEVMEEGGGPCKLLQWVLQRSRTHLFKGWWMQWNFSLHTGSVQGSCALCQSTGYGCLPQE